eukprot:CAMPEP_0119560716 /NCGR_PEP_ID=MMETSP1352-20130426/15693_1 /TAXON_ID=265584 /ORGANISM="Stauroneis constricta, Strain CCMP1120" /LENGTH=329 /DNA_ID=CAMNT_0007608765 /DNA_START=450 /DNA_END=1436 /DNA_ORIENTATION=+
MSPSSNSNDNNNSRTLDALATLFAESSANRKLNMTELFNEHASKQDDFDSNCLLHRMGGDGQLINLLRHFFELVLDDPVLAPFFAGCDISSIKNEATQFLTLLLGNKLPKDFDVELYFMEQQFSYYDRSDSVKATPIDQEHYDLFVGYLPEACDEVASMQEELVDELMDLFLPYGRIFNEEYRDRKIRHVMLKTAQHNIDQRMKDGQRISEPTRGRVARTISGEGGGLGGMAAATKGQQRRRPSKTGSGKTERSQSLKNSSGGIRPRPKNPAAKKGRSQSVTAANMTENSSMGGSDNRIMRRKSGEHLRNIFSGLKTMKVSTRKLTETE